MAAAKTAAGIDFKGILGPLCMPGAQLPPRAPGPSGIDTVVPAPPTGTWYASPYQVFDNLYWLGTRQHSSWLLKTSAGLILIDTNFAWSTEPEILDGMKKLGFDPHQIKYIILSHAHGDHDQGVATLQKFGAHVVMGAPDWDATVKRPANYPGEVPTRGPDDISVGPAGKTITLGDTTVTIVLTPGHTPGTLSRSFRSRIMARPWSLHIPVER